MALRTKTGVRTHSRSAQRRQVCQPDQRRWPASSRLVHRGVGQHHAAQLVAVLQRPAERDDAAPVVGRRVTTGPVTPSAAVSPPRSRPARPACAARRAVGDSPCRAGRARPPASRAARPRTSAATGRTRSGCRARRAASAAPAVPRGSESSTCQYRRRPSAAHRLDGAGPGRDPAPAGPAVAAVSAWSKPVRRSPADFEQQAFRPDPMPISSTRHRADSESSGWPG